VAAWALSQWNYSTAKMLLMLPHQQHENTKKINTEVNKNTRSSHVSKLSLLTKPTGA